MLAKIQAKIVGKKLQSVYPELIIEYYTSTTIADRDIQMNISKSESTGLFTRDISRKIISGEFDIAVHSWKDLPVDLPKETKIIGTIKRGDMRDILIIKNNTATNFGAGVGLVDSYSNITNVLFENNHIPDGNALGGGAIAVNGGTTSIDNCIIKNNSGYNSIIHINEANVRIERSLIIDNTCTNNNNSYEVLKKINSLVIIEGTNTNVADVQLLYIF